MRSSAQRNLQRGQIEKAIKDYTRIVEDDPNDIRTLLKIGDLHTRCGNFTEATSAYNKVASHYEDDGFHLKAVAVYKQVLKIDNSLREIHFKLASLYIELGLLSDACIQYEQLGLIYESDQDYDESIKCLEKILELDSANIPVRLKLAELMVQAMQVAHATAHFIKAAKKLKRQGRIEDANKVLERIYDLDPENLNVALESAEIYLELGETRRALAKLQPCFDKNTKDIRTLNLMGQAFSTLKATRKAAMVYEALAHIHRDTGERAQYISTLEILLKLNPEHAQVKAVLENIDRYWPQSAELAPHAIETSQSGELPKSQKIKTLNEEIAVFEEYGLIEKVTEHLRKIIDIDPKNTNARNRLQELDPESVIDIAANVELIEDISPGPRLKTAQLKAFILEDDGLADQSPEALEVQLETNDDDGITIETEDSITIAYQTQTNNSEIHDALKGLALNDTDSEYFVSEVFSKFKQGVEKEVSNEDIQTHYDLGIAYMEMGLLQDAIREFSFCLEKDEMRINGLLMQGTCYRQLQQYQQSIEVLEKAINDKSLSADEKMNLHYEKALTHEQAGDVALAKQHYELVSKKNAGFRETKARLEILETLNEI
ncbi:MAG: tetratricopeptide repeat protein [Myxococcota bacterium]|nr:tetratricopeptide repeat protein [Myxococcota bacterium]